jgi:hypothetical protein
LKNLNGLEPVTLTLHRQIEHGVYSPTQFARVCQSAAFQTLGQLFARKKLNLTKEDTKSMNKFERTLEGDESKEVVNNAMHQLHIFYKNNTDGGLKFTIYDPNSDAAIINRIWINALKTIKLALYVGNDAEGLIQGVTRILDDYSMSRLEKNNFEKATEVAVYVVLLEMLNEDFSDDYNGSMLASKRIRSVFPWLNDEELVNLFGVDHAKQTVCMMNPVDLVPLGDLMRKCNDVI